MHIRLLVTAYLFLSGFGHFTYFWHTGDISFHRLWKVWLEFYSAIILTILTFRIKGHLPNQSSGCLPLFVYEQAISVLLLRSIGFVLVFSDVCLFLCHTTRHCCHCRWYVFINCYSKSHYLTVHSQPIQFNTYMWS